MIRNLNQLWQELARGETTMLKTIPFDKMDLYVFPYETTNSIARSNEIQSLPLLFPIVTLIQSYAHEEYYIWDYETEEKWCSVVQEFISMGFTYETGIPLQRRVENLHAILESNSNKSFFFLHAFVKIFHIPGLLYLLSRIVALDNGYLDEMPTFLHVLNLIPHQDNCVCKEIEKLKELVRFDQWITGDMIRIKA